MARPNAFENARSIVMKGGMPITIGTIVLAAIGFIAWWSTKHSPTWFTLIFSADGWLTRPWSLVTYPFIEGDFIRLVFGGLMAFFFMGALERAWSKDRFLPAYVILLILPPLALWLGFLVTGADQIAMGLWLVTGCWTVAFGAYRPQAVILIFGIVPVKAMWIAWFAALAIVFYYGQGAPLAGLCAGLAPLAAWALGTRRVTMRLPRKEQPAGDEFRKSLKTKRDLEQERLRLRELLERSVQDDEQP